MINVQTLKKNYEDKPKQVVDYMNNLIDALSKEFGEDIDPSWQSSLDMVCDWFQVYINALDDIKEHGAVVKSPSGVTKTNPAFNILNTSTRIINDILRTFAATPLAKSKLKALGKNSSPVSDAMLLQSLVS